MRLIVSTIYWRLSWQRSYALIFRQPGWHNGVKCCDLTSCKSWLTFTWKTMVQLGTQLWSKTLARRYTPVPNGSGCARLKKNLDQRENLTLWMKYSFGSIIAVWPTHCLNLYGQTKHVKVWIHTKRKNISRFSVGTINRTKISNLRKFC